MARVRRNRGCARSRDRSGRNDLRDDRRRTIGRARAAHPEAETDVSLRRPGLCLLVRHVDQRGRLLIAAASRDRAIRLLDSRRTAFVRTPWTAHTLAELASWADTNDTRWLVAPAGAVVAWKVVEHDSVPALQTGWVSRAAPAPLAAAVVNDVVFVVSRGPQPPSPAVVYALDGATGQELWSSGTTIPTSVRAGLSAGEIGRAHV